MKAFSTLKMLLVCLLVVCCNIMYGQAGQWTWMKGDSTANHYGVYGTIGISSPLNTPGSRTSSVNWTDSVGNFWLFGGFGYAASGQPNYLNDIWKYNIITNEWTWVKGDSISNPQQLYGLQGISSPLNKPSGREASAGWTDATGNFWIFGGNINYEFSPGNDLWKYNPSTNEWTWMKGDTTTNLPGRYGIQGVGSSNNNPGARISATTYKDTSGNLWLFGGSGEISYSYADMWKYNIAVNEWTWMSGDTTGNGNGNIRGFYGLQGLSSPSNTPGTRSNSLGWTDTIGQFWLFGGFSFSSTFYSFYNDLWKYNNRTNQWTWVKGDSTPFTRGVYGIMGVSLTTNTPGARFGSSTWKDKNDKFWMFGGRGWDASAYGILNDLWSYNASTNEWVWIKGDSSLNSKGSYGTQGISSDNNNPSATAEAAGWTDNNDNFWLYGGSGYDTTFASYQNNLWRFTLGNSVPVHLLTFTARLQDKQTHLAWTVENEQSFDRYEVQRSSNGKDFSPIGAVKAINAKAYSYIDNVSSELGVVSNLLYYRLKLIDRDGKFTYSAVRQVTINHSPLTIAIFPNPAHGSFQLQLSNAITGKVTVEISDVSGKVVLQKSVEVSGGSINISTNKISAGTYTVKLLSNNEQFAQKLVIMK